MAKTASLAGAIILVFLLAACAAGSAGSRHVADGGDLAQLLLGFWHGFIAPLTLVIEIVNRLAPHLLPWRVKLYEASNTGAAYDFGFYFGLVGGPTLAWRRWSRK